MKSYEYVLVDWDGCIAKTLEIWVAGYKEELLHYGIDATDQEIGFHLGDWGFAKHFGIDDHAKFGYDVVANVSEKLLEVELYPGAKENLTNLTTNGKKLALVSSSSGHILNAGLKHNGVESLFNAVITGDDVTNHKPDPEPLIKALDLLNGNKEQAIMMGDSRKDLGAANNFGIDSILVYHPNHDTFYLHKELKSLNPTYVIRHFDELSDIIVS